MIKFFVKNLLKRIAPVFYNELVTKVTYNRIARETADKYFVFMNYGYAVPGDDEMQLELLEVDEPYRLSVQLYEHVTRKIEIIGKEVLEVGCGRGGGAYYLKQYRKAQKVVGLDLSGTAVKMCSDTYPLDGLVFQQGSAESLPFEDRSFDVVVNIESSHCYLNCSTFFNEVRRVLKLGGYFCYANFGSVQRMNDVRQMLVNSDFTIINSKDITPNVLESLRRGTDNRLAFFGEVLKDDEKRFEYMINMARVKGTPGYKAFKTREDIYLSYLVQNPVKTK